MKMYLRLTSIAIVFVSFVLVATARTPEFVANHKLPIQPFAPPVTVYCSGREEWFSVLQVLPNGGELTISNQKFWCRIPLTTSWDTNAVGNVTYTLSPSTCSEAAAVSIQYLFLSRNAAGGVTFNTSGTIASNNVDNRFEFDEISSSRCGMPLMPINTEFCGRDAQGQDLFAFAKSTKPLQLDLDVVTSINSRICKLSGTYVEVDGFLSFQHWSTSGNNCGSGFSIKQIAYSPAELEIRVTAVVNEEWLTFILSVDRCGNTKIPSGYYSAIVGSFATLLHTTFTTADNVTRFELTVTPTSQVVIGCEMSGAYRIVAGGVLFTIAARSNCNEYSHFAVYVSNGVVAMQIGARGQYTPQPQVMRGPYGAVPQLPFGVYCGANSTNNFTTVLNVSSFNNIELLVGGNDVPVTDACRAVATAGVIVELYIFFRTFSVTGCNDYTARWHHIMLSQWTTFPAMPLMTLFQDLNATTTLMNRTKLLDQIWFNDGNVTDALTLFSELIRSYNFSEPSINTTQFVAATLNSVGYVRSNFDLMSASRYSSVPSIVLTLQYQHALHPITAGAGLCATLDTTMGCSASAGAPGRLRLGTDSSKVSFLETTLGTSTHFLATCVLTLTGVYYVQGFVIARSSVLACPRTFRVTLISFDGTATQLSIWYDNREAITQVFQATSCELVGNMSLCAAGNNGMYLLETYAPTLPVNQTTRLVTDDGYGKMTHAGPGSFVRTCEVTLPKLFSVGGYLVLSGNITYNSFCNFTVYELKAVSVVGGDAVGLLSFVDVIEPERVGLNSSRCLYFPTFTVLCGTVSYFDAAIVFETSAQAPRFGVMAYSFASKGSQLSPECAASNFIAPVMIDGTLTVSAAGTVAFPQCTFATNLSLSYTTQPFFFPNMTTSIVEMGLLVNGTFVRAHQGYLEESQCTIPTGLRCSNSSDLGALVSNISRSTQQNVLGTFSSEVAPFATSGNRQCATSVTRAVFVGPNMMSLGGVISSSGMSCGGYALVNASRNMSNNDMMTLFWQSGNNAAVPIVSDTAYCSFVPPVPDAQQTPTNSVDSIRYCVGSGPIIGVVTTNNNTFSFALTASQPLNPECKGTHLRPIGVRSAMTFYDPPLNAYGGIFPISCTLNSLGAIQIVNIRFSNNTSTLLIDVTGAYSGVLTLGTGQCEAAANATWCGKTSIGLIRMANTVLTPVSAAVDISMTNSPSNYLRSCTMQISEYVVVGTTFFVTGQSFASSACTSIITSFEFIANASSIAVKTSAGTVGIVSSGRCTAFPSSPVSYCTHTRNITGVITLNRSTLSYSFTHRSPLNPECSSLGDLIDPFGIDEIVTFSTASSLARPFSASCNVAYGVQAAGAIGLATIYTATDATSLKITTIGAIVDTVSFFPSLCSVAQDLGNIGRCGKTSNGYVVATGGNSSTNFSSFSTLTTFRTLQVSTTNSENELRRVCVMTATAVFMAGTAYYNLGALTLALACNTTALSRITASSSGMVGDVQLDTFDITFMNSTGTVSSSRCTYFSGNTSDYCFGSVPVGGVPSATAIVALNNISLSFTMSSPERSLQPECLNRILYEPIGVDGVITFASYSSNLTASCSSVGSAGALLQFGWDSTQTAVTAMLSNAGPLYFRTGLCGLATPFRSCAATSIGHVVISSVTPQNNATFAYASLSLQSAMGVAAYDTRRSCTYDVASYVVVGSTLLATSSWTTSGCSLVLTLTTTSDATVTVYNGTALAGTTSTSRCVLFSNASNYCFGSAPVGGVPSATAIVALNNISLSFTMSSPERSLQPECLNRILYEPIGVDGVITFASYSSNLTASCSSVGSAGALLQFGWDSTQTAVTAMLSNAGPLYFRTGLCGLATPFRSCAATSIGHVVISSVTPQNNATFAYASLSLQSATNVSSGDPRRSCTYDVASYVVVGSTLLATSSWTTSGCSLLLSASVNPYTSTASLYNGSSFVGTLSPERCRIYSGAYCKDLGTGGVVARALINSTSLCFQMTMINPLQPECTRKFYSPIQIDDFITFEWDIAPQFPSRCAVVNSSSVSNTLEIPSVTIVGDVMRFGDVATLNNVSSLDECWYIPTPPAPTIDRASYCGGVIDRPRYFGLMAVATTPGASPTISVRIIQNLRTICVGQVVVSSFVGTAGRVASKGFCSTGYYITNVSFDGFMLNVSIETPIKNLTIPLKQDRCGRLPHNQLICGTLSDKTNIIFDGASDPVWVTIEATASKTDSIIERCATLYDKRVVSLTVDKLLIDPPQGCDSYLPGLKIGTYGDNPNYINISTDTGGTTRSEDSVCDSPLADKSSYCGVVRSDAVSVAVVMYFTNNWTYSVYFRNMLNSVVECRTQGVYRFVNGNVVFVDGVERCRSFFPLDFLKWSSVNDVIFMTIRGAEGILSPSGCSAVPTRTSHCGMYADITFALAAEPLVAGVETYSELGNLSPLMHMVTVTFSQRSGAIQCQGRAAAYLVEGTIVFVGPLLAPTCAFINFLFLTVTHDAKGYALHATSNSLPVTMRLDPSLCVVVPPGSYLTTIAATSCCDSKAIAAIVTDNDILLFVNEEEVPRSDALCAVRLTNFTMSTGFLATAAAVTVPNLQCIAPLSVSAMSYVGGVLSISGSISTQGGTMPFAGAVLTKVDVAVAQTLPSDVYFSLPKINIAFQLLPDRNARKASDTYSRYDVNAPLFLSANVAGIKGTFSFDRSFVSSCEFVADFFYRSPRGNYIFVNGSTTCANDVVVTYFVTEQIAEVQLGGEYYVAERPAVPLPPPPPPPCSTTCIIIIVVVLGGAAMLIGVGCAVKNFLSKGSAVSPMQVECS